MERRVNTNRRRGGRVHINSEYFLRHHASERIYRAHTPSRKPPSFSEAVTFIEATVIVIVLAETLWTGIGPAASLPV